MISIHRMCTVLLVSLIATTTLLTACGPTQYSLSTSVSPDGGGTVSPATGTYDEGSEVEITAEPAPGYRFDHWSDDATGTDSTVIITMDANKSITANFKTQYTLSTSASPSWGGAVNPATGTYDPGTEVTLTAEPISGCSFDHWSDDATGTSSSVTITMDDNKSVTAHFKAQYTLYTSVSPDGGGTVDPATGTYDTGTEVTLTANPASGYVFNYWSGDATGTSSSITITMDATKLVTAHFYKLQVPPVPGEWTGLTDIGSLSFTVNADGTGITECTIRIPGTFTCGTNPRITMTGAAFSLYLPIPITGSHADIEWRTGDNWEIQIVVNFDSTGTHASGTWSISAGGSQCASGTWEASPSS